MPERDRRVCRVCGTAYVFPAPRSTATRFYCEPCAALDPALRRVLEALQKRVTRLQAEVEALRKKTGEAAAGARQRGEEPAPSEE